MNTNTNAATKTAGKAVEGRKKAATKRAPHEVSEKAEAAFMKRMKTEADEAAKKAAMKTAEEEKTAEQAEERKEGKTMKKTAENAAKTAPKNEAAAEAVKTAAPKLSERIAAALEAAKTGSRREDRAKAAEEAAALILKFNRESFANAVNRADMMKAAEALKPHAPKKAEARRAGYAYANAENIVSYQFMDEDGHESTRTLSLVQYAAAAFMKTATDEAAAAFRAALHELEKVSAAAVEGREENGKAAAAALTALVKACGLEGFTTKTAENSKKYGFYIDRSFVYAAAAPLKLKRGEAKTAAAVLEAATLTALEASEARREKAEARRAKAEAAAVKAVFAIIAAAAEAAAVNVWKAYVKTAEGVRLDWKKAAEEAAKREGERAAKKAEREAKTAAAKLEKAAKLREQAAALEKAAAEQEAKKTAAA